MWHSPWPLFPSWSLPGPSWCPLHCPPARWWPLRADWWWASLSPAARTRWCWKRADKGGRSTQHYLGVNYVWSQVYVSPKGINISSIRKRKSVLIVSGTHFTHDFWSQITDPPMRKLQLVFTSKNTTDPLNYRFTVTIRVIKSNTVTYRPSWTTPEIPKRPKSVMTTLFVSWKTFLDLRSLWTMPLAWR